jgi:AmiR/NasT family two-component response regulator
VGGDDPWSENHRDRLSEEAITIWQAEGVLMQLLALEPPAASQRLRQVAEDRGETLFDAAATIVRIRGLPD